MASRSFRERRLEEVRRLPIFVLEEDCYSKFLDELEKRPDASSDDYPKVRIFLPLSSPCRLSPSPTNYQRIE
jgi:hypothetical protein